MSNAQKEAAKIGDARGDLPNADWRNYSTGANAKPNHLVHGNRQI